VSAIAEAHVGLMLATVLSVAAGVLALALGAVWFRLLRQVRIPADRRPFLAGNAAAVGLGIAGLALGAGGLAAVLAAVAILSGAAFLGLAAQSAQARREPAVAVGDRVVDFTLPDHTGRSFDLASLHGTPFLLKFFRGHW
jgi:hypothetical protein